MTDDVLLLIFVHDTTGTGRRRECEMMKMFTSANAENASRMWVVFSKEQVCGSCMLLAVAAYCTF